MAGRNDRIHLFAAWYFQRQALGLSPLWGCKSKLAPDDNLAQQTSKNQILKMQGTRRVPIRPSRAVVSRLQPGYAPSPVIYGRAA